MEPKVSIIIPTLNASSVLEDCLKSIDVQNYPKNQIEIIIADGGSTDTTLEIAKKYGAIVLSNPLKTAESGKAVGVKASTGEFIALVDSDNILPNEKWLIEMIAPLKTHAEAAGSEPWSYTLRKEDGFISRYCALIGMNDPFVHFLGNYDRLNLLTGKWTGVEHDSKDFGDYIYATFDSRGLPTIGANGTVFRSSFLKNEVKGDYLFDIDILAAKIKRDGKVDFIKVKNGIIHTFCEADVLKFAKKQRRRVKDFLYHKSKGNREYEWQQKGFLSNSAKGMIKFIFSCVTVLPLIYQMIKGFIKKPDTAWFFHPLACEVTLWEYGFGTLKGIFKKEEASREGWKQ